MDFASILRSEFGSRYSWQSPVSYQWRSHTSTYLPSPIPLEDLWRARDSTSIFCYRYSIPYSSVHSRSPPKELVNFLFMRFLRRLAKFIRFALSTSSKSRIYSPKLPSKYGITKEIAGLGINLSSGKNSDGDFLAADFPGRLHSFSSYFIHCFEATKSPIKFLRQSFMRFAHREAEGSRLSKRLFFSRISLFLSLWCLIL